MHRFTFLVALLAFMLVLPVAGANRALIIGIGDYPGTDADLPGIDKDVEFAKQIASLMGFRPGEIVVLMDGQATLGNIREKFNTWLREAGPDDQVLVYFSGHGAYVRDTNGDEDDGQDELWVTADTRVANGRLENYLLDDEVDQLLAGLSSNNVLVILDSCHSGSASKSVGDFVEKRLPYEGREYASAKSRGVGRPQHALIAACRDTQTAGATSRGSLLTTALLDSIANRKQRNEPLRLRELPDELARTITPRKRDQHPVVAGNPALLDRDWMRPVGSTSAPTLPPPPAQPAPGVPAGFSAAAAQVEEIYLRRSGDLNCTLDRGSNFRSGGRATVTCQLPSAGYLYLLNIGEGDKTPYVLLPNRWVPNNHVEAGAVVIPSPQRNFTVRMALPQGMDRQRVRLYALLSYQQVKSIPEDFSAGFGAFTQEGARSLVAEGPEGYLGGRIDFEIVR